MKKLAMFLLFILTLSGCQDKEEEYINHEQLQTEKRLAVNKRENESLDKFFCSVYKEAAPAIFWLEHGDVECPKDNKPFSDELGTVFLFIIVVIFNILLIFGVYFASKLAIILASKISSKGEGVGQAITALAIKIVVLLCMIPIPFFNYLSLSVIALSSLFYKGLNRFEINLSYLEATTELAQNVKIEKPYDGYQQTSTLNLIAFYESVRSANKDKSIDVNFSVEGDTIKAEAVYYKSMINVTQKLNVTAYEASDKYGLGYGKDYQIQQIEMLLTHLFREADKTARKTTNYRTGIFTAIDEEDFSKISCSDIDSYSLNDVSLRVVQGYRARKAFCMDRDINQFFNNVGAEFKDHKAIKVDLCPSSSLNSNMARGCVANAYSKGLYAGSVATEYFVFFKTKESNVVTGFFEFPNYFFKGKLPVLTETGKVFYNSLDIKYTNDIEKPEYSNRFNPSAFKISLTGEYNLSQRDRHFLQNLDSSEDSLDGTTIDTANFIDLAKQTLTGADGICGWSRYDECITRPEQNTKNYSCLGETEEESIFGNKLMMCGATIKTMAFVKQVLRGQRSKQVEGIVTKAAQSAPSFLGGLAIFAPVVGIASFDALTGDAWNTPELSYQSNEAYLIYAMAVLSSNKLEKINDRIANSLIAIGMYKAYILPVMKYAVLVAIPMFLILWALAQIIFITINLIKNFYDKRRDETLDFNKVWVEIGRFIWKPTSYIVAAVLANHAYQQAIYAVNTSGFSNVLIFTESFSLMNGMMYIASETFMILLNSFLMYAIWGNISEVSKFSEKMFSDDDLTDLVSDNESESTVRSSSVASRIKDKK